jgi:hypothetical protein
LGCVRADSGGGIQVHFARRAATKPKIRPRRLLEGHPDLREIPPNDTAFSHRAARIEGKFEFGRKVCDAQVVQAGTLNAHISDDAIDGRAAGQDNLGALIHLSPCEPSALKHSKLSNPQLDRKDLI